MASPQDVAGLEITLQRFFLLMDRGVVVLNFLCLHQLQAYGSPLYNDILMPFLGARVSDTVRAISGVFSLVAASAPILFMFPLERVLFLALLESLCLFFPP